jgi:penicillin-binding protein 2
MGQIISKDFPNALKGDLPTQEYYDNIYGKERWNALTVRSLAIGQGELGITPLQMVNCCAVFANRGFYFEPHMVKAVEDDTVRSSVLVKHEVGIDAGHFEPILTGMAQVAQGRLTRSIPGVEYCGKTGTIQNPHGLDHSAYIAFAPKDKPEIAIFVYVENGGYGATHAAPMASLMIEHYLNDTIANNRKWIEQRMIDANLLNPNQSQ